MAWCTCRGGAQDHWLSSGDAEVPDAVPVAHILFEQLAQSPGPCGGFKTGHNLSREEREVGMMEKNDKGMNCSTKEVKLKKVQVHQEGF